MTSLSLSAALQAARATIPPNVHDFDKVFDLLTGARSDIKQGVVLLDALDSVSVVVSLMQEASGTIRFDNSVQHPEQIVIELSTIKDKPQWLVDLLPHLQPLIFQQLADLSPEAAEDTLFAIFQPRGVKIGQDHNTFQMGDTKTSAPRSAKPAHTVSLSSFWMGITEVTQALYWQVMGENPSQFVGMARPVENISWFDAIQFCNALSRAHGYQEAYDIIGEDVTWVNESNGFRLPTEAEWEFAASQGQHDVVSLSERAWWTDDWDGSTQAIMQLAPNRFGLYDIQGNVSEWCWDWFGQYTSSHQTNPTGSSDGRTKVHRGGSWMSQESDLDIHTRSSLSPIVAIGSIGLRLCRSIEQA